MVRTKVYNSPIYLAADVETARELEAMRDAPVDRSLLVKPRPEPDPVDEYQRYYERQFGGRAR